MTVDEFSKLLSSGFPVVVALGGWLGSYFTMKATFNARIMALEVELKRHQEKDYGPFTESVKQQNLTMWGKFDAMSSQVTQILQSVTEVKTIVGMMKQTKE